MRVAVVTNFPSHYQVDTFNVLAADPSVELKVFYLRRLTPGRHWTALRTVDHPHEYLPEWRVNQHFYVSPGLHRAVRAFRPDVLVVTQYASIGMQTLMYEWAARRKSWVYWSEAPNVRYTELPIVTSKTLRSCLRAVALWPLNLGPRQVWGIGQKACADFRRVTRARVENVPYVFDQSVFRGIERGPVRRPVTFLYSGKLVYRKAFDVLVAATELLAARRNDFRVIVMGDGPERALLEKTPAAARALMIPIGFKELAQVPQVYADGDALVFPSRYDGWGLAVVEAMAAGMPVVASRGATSALDLVRDGVSGYLVENGNAEALARAMARLLDAPDHIRRMGEAARTAVESLTASRGAERIMGLLREAISS